MVELAPYPGRHNDLTDVAGIRVGHHQRRGHGWLTGTTVILTPEGTVGGVDVRGGGPSSRETDALAPTTLVDVVHAVVLSGGSSYGLAASVGVTDWLGERGVGFPVGPASGHVVPIVPAACLFDLGVGGSFGHRPDAAFGRAAAETAAGPGGRRVRQGTVGAGTGAHAGVLKGGLGSASVVLASGITVAALVVLNPGGSVFDPRTGDLYGRRHLLPGELPGLRRPNAAEARAAHRPRPVVADRPDGPGANTTLAVVAIDARLTKAECSRLAVAAHDGMARAVLPIHAMTDGDVAFALATGAHELPVEPATGPAGLRAVRPHQLTELMAAAADAVTRAIVYAVMTATSTPTMTSYQDLFPSAYRR